MRLPLLLALALTLAPAAGAESQPGSQPRSQPRSQPEWTGWDDSHMLSNFARQRGPAPPRPAVQGSGRYHQILADPAPAPATRVEETTLELSQHEWKKGTLAGAGTGKPLLGSSGSSGSIGSGRPTVSSGVRAHSSTRSGSSGLRSSSLGNQRRTRR